MLGRHDQIAGQRDLQPAPQRKPIDRRNHRLVQIEATRQARKAARRIFVAALLRAHLQVGARAKAALARAANDSYPQVTVCRKGVEYPSQLKVGRGMQGVENLRPVEDDVQDWVEDMLACAPLALRATKQVARRNLDYSSLAEALRGDYPAAERMLESEDAVEGPRAFAEKRAPVWRGR